MQPLRHFLVPMHVGLVNSNQRTFKLTTYIEMKAKAEAMLAEAEVMRKAELVEVIKGIKQTMAEYGLTAADLGAAPSARKPVKSKSTAPAKYCGPNGETWAGGLGRKPEWVRALLADGKNIDDYLI